MINWFAYLEFKKFSDECRCTFTELDSFADYTFRNGIWVRVVVGRMADTKPTKPYELIVRRLHGIPFSIPNLDKHDVIMKFDELAKEKPIQ